MPYRNRIRLPIMFCKPQFPMERNVFRLANGVSKTLSVVIRNTYEGKTDQLPEDWHRKLVIAMSHDDVSIENERLLSNVVLDGDYGIDWQDFLSYPIAQADFKIQVTPFNATNSNCQTCDEMSQLNLVDDSTDEVWEEGTTNEFTDVLTDNDSICCLPFIITLVNWNTLYFTSVSISEGGVLTATVIDPAPVVDDVWIGRYRVTCPDGSYDEADVYGNISGSDVSFCAPVNNIITNPVSSTSVNMQWDADVPAPNSFIWQLFLSSDLATPVQSGTLPTGSNNLTLTGLTAGLEYVFSLVVDCGAYDYSNPTTETFTITSFAAETCGNFTITYLPDVDSAPQSISYMSCAGTIIDREFTVAQEVAICMLISAGSEIPIYFVASSVDISINYTGLCE